MPQASTAPGLVLTGSVLFAPLLRFRNPMADYLKLARVASSLSPCLSEGLSVFTPALLYPLGDKLLSIGHNDVLEVGCRVSCPLAALNH